MKFNSDNGGFEFVVWECRECYTSFALIYLGCVFIQGNYEGEHIACKFCGSTFIHKPETS